MSRLNTNQPSAIAAVTVDGAGIVTSASAAALAMLNMPAQSVIGARVDAILMDAENADLRLTQSSMVGHGSADEGRLVILTPLDHAPLRPDDDQAQLRLAAGMAHDFGNLLAIISGHLQMAECRTGDAALREHIRQSLLACAMGARMTRRLRTFARQQPFDAQPHDINALVEPVATALGQILEHHRTFVCDLTPGIPFITVDRSEFENALLNLLLNALDATREDGTITIATRMERGDGPSNYANLIVTDNGTGMPDHIAQRAFEPFFSTKPPDQGTGLGLATVAGFARQCGGCVELATHRGIGTTVTLRLPVRQTGPART